MPLPTVPRPLVTDPAVAQRYVTFLMPHVRSWAEGMGLAMAAPETVIEDLSEAVATSDDGYERARYLDVECGWLVNSALVALLETSNSIRLTAHRDVQAEWVMEQGVRFQAEEGDRVTFRKKGALGNKSGKVLAVFGVTAHALVSLPGKTATEPSTIVDVYAEDVTHVQVAGEKAVVRAPAPVLTMVGFQLQEVAPDYKQVAAS